MQANGGGTMSSSTSGTDADAQVMARGARAMLGELFEVTDAEQLDDFFERRIVVGEVVDHRDVAMMRQLLHYLYKSLCVPTDAAWERLRLAWSATCSDARSDLEHLLGTEKPAVGEESAKPAEVGRAAPPAAPQPPVDPPRIGFHQGPPEPVASLWVSEGQPSNSPEAGIDATAFMASLEVAETDAPLPFSGTRNDAPERPREEQPHEDVGQTAAVDLAKIASTKTTASSEKPEGEPPIPVERYAMVVACTEDADDARRAQVHAQVGLESEEDRRKLDQEYGRFLRSSSELKLQFIRDLKRWKDWLDGQRAPE